MVKTLILLQILLSTKAVLSKSVRSGHELRYIGSFKSKSIQGRNNEIFDETKYFVSPNSASWNSAVADCKNQLGPNGTLLSIESEEEWKFLKEHLDNYGFGTTYWTSGIYDPSETLWKWTVNHHALPSFAPWGTGYPSKPNTLLRVLLYYTNQYNTNWRTVSSTQLHRYICEIQGKGEASTVSESCYQTSDLAIVLDASGSVGYNYFATVKTYVQRLADAFTFYPRNRLVFITYSDYPTTRIRKTNTLRREEISFIIRSTRWEGGNTATYTGIDLAVDELTSSPRRNVPLNMIVFTSGDSAWNDYYDGDVANAWPYYTIDASNRAISKGIQSFAVRLSPYSDQQELLTIAGNNSSRVFTTENIDELIELVAPANQHSICPEDDWSGENENNYVNEF